MLLPVQPILFGKCLQKKMLVLVKLVFAGIKGEAFVAQTRPLIYKAVVSSAISTVKKILPQRD